MFAFLVQVLQLSHISLLSSVPEGSNMKIDVSTGMAYVHVSPPTIKTLTACLMSLAPAKVFCEIEKRPLHSKTRASTRTKFSQY